MPNPIAPGRFAIVLKGYPRLSETFIAQELQALEARGHQFDLWPLNRPYDEPFHPIHDDINATKRYLPEYLYQEPLRLLRALKKVARSPRFWPATRVWLGDLRRDRSPNRIRRFGQAIVLAAELPAETCFLYAHFLHTPASVTRYAAMIRGIAWGFSAHAKDIWTVPDWDKREKITDCRFGVTCTKTGAAHLRNLDLRGDKISLVYHGLDLSRFPDPPDIRPTGGRFTLLAVGRLVAKKGFGDMLEALSRLPEDLDWRLVHIGGGELQRGLENRARRLELDHRIEWMGKKAQGDVIAAMRSADLFVLPSKIADDGDRDGLPNVLMEAASQKLPVLTSDISAIPEFITDGVHGTLVPPGDPVALADAITALAADPDRRVAMAEAAYQRLIADFGMDSGIETIDSQLRAAVDAATTTSSFGA